MTWHVKVGGSWKEITDPQVKISGVWKEIAEGHVKVSGAWKQFYSRFDPDLKSISFDGDLEKLSKDSDVDVGIGNTWSILIWGKRENSSDFGEVFDIIKAGANNDRIVVINNNTSGDLLIWLYNSSATRFKNYTVSSFWTNDAWVNLVLTWNGTTLNIYKNSSITSPTKTTDNAGSQSSINRQVGLGNNPNNGSTLGFEGLIHSAAVWDVVLDSDAITELYNSGDGADIDYSIDGTDYTSSGDLLHWWRVGYDSGDIGADSGNHSTLIDLMDDAENITVDDIVEDYPGM